MPALSQSLTFTINSTSTVVVDYPNTGTSTIVYISDKTKGDGYFNGSDGLHTVMYISSIDFVGTVTMEATLASHPSETDWFTIPNTTTEYQLTDVRSTPSVDLHNFVGNYVWVRGQISIDQGAVSSIRYNH